jgi:hypothetical protein
MDQTTTGIVLAIVMGFVGGLLTVPIHALINARLKREELDYAQKLESIAKQRELLLQHKLEIERKGKDRIIEQFSKRLENLERNPGHE